ncbi:MAG: proprotein convertase P-domain-containing protein [Sandaracinaceae bacterium]|nr:proprotein convertase P-domain-containing protein [Sandaracinaceae bacterium]
MRINRYVSLLALAAACWISACTKIKALPGMDAGASDGGVEMDAGASDGGGEIDVPNYDSGEDGDIHIEVHASRNIPDHTEVSGGTDGEITSTYEVLSHSCRIVSIDLIRVQVNNPCQSDLSFELMSPAGTSVTLRDQSGDCTLNAGYFEYNAASPPEGPGALREFVGEDPTGVWTLRVVDHVTGHIGALGIWTVDIQCR